MEVSASDQVTKALRRLRPIWHQAQPIAVNLGLQESIAFLSSLNGYYAVVQWRTWRASDWQAQLVFVKRN